MAKLHELWADLRSSPASSTVGFSLRLFSVGHDLRLYAALKNPGGEPAIVVEIPTAFRPNDLARISTRTFEAVVADFPGLPQGHCAISIVLHQPEYQDLFEFLAEEIAVAVQGATSTHDAAKAVVRRIDRWRRFLERSRRRLTDEDMRGIIGELVILARCIGKFGGAIAVAAWQGMGGLRDFELPEFSVEAKTYQAETGAAVRISNPQQLEGSTARPVYLAVVRLARSEVSGRTLGDTVAYVTQMLQSEASVLDDFHDRLADRGFLAPDAGSYTERFSTGNVQLFAVRAAFPRIATASVPAGLTDVHFSVLLSAIAAYAVDISSHIGAPSALEVV
jgi:hypothetical protein